MCQTVISIKLQAVLVVLVQLWVFTSTLRLYSSYHFSLASTYRRSGDVSLLITCSPLADFVDHWYICPVSKNVLFLPQRFTRIIQVCCVWSYSITTSNWCRLVLCRIRCDFCARYMGFFSHAINISNCHFPPQLLRYVSNLYCASLFLIIC